ncbi:MAG: UDP-N-acetylmuramoyl-L-alanine--D-glutamate ligase [Pseudomonadales bacterium]|nr:UDP-N-acetylmuramoyl-L-alanine--D-glutamate ligase [Pseudomonadales bacterium]
MAKRYLILGLGKSGLSAARYLCRQNVECVLADTRSEILGLELFIEAFPDVKVFLEHLPFSLLEGVDVLVISPGLSPQLPLVKEAKQKDIEIIGDVELFCQRASSPIIAITGTNAKSTVVTLIAKIISEAGYRVGLGGNIGTPALELLSEDGNEPDYYVLELSSFQLESTPSLSAKVAAVLNASPDHMDRYDSFEDYVTTKQRIYHNSEVALYNRDDGNTYPGDQAARKVSFGMERSDDASEISYFFEQEFSQVYLYHDNERILSADSLLISGDHNYLNCLAAMAVCDVIGIEQEKQINSLQQFSGLEHRCETVANIDGVRWINDSKGTNIGATLAALRGFGKRFPKKIILILGGVSKDASFSPLMELINQYVKKVLVYGQDSAKIIADIEGGVNCPIDAFESLDQTVNDAKKNSKNGGLVLFSPACASFDMFKSFEHRGEAFKTLVLDAASHPSRKAEGV